MSLVIENKISTGSMVNFGMLLLAGGITYGVMSAQLKAQEERIGKVELTVKENLLDAATSGDVTEVRIRSLEVTQAATTTDLQNIRVIEATQSSDLKNIQMGISDLKSAISALTVKVQK